METNRGVYVAALICLLPALADLVSAQTALPLGEMRSGRTTSESPMEYRLSVESAGVLAVAVHGEGDLVLLVMDGDGQLLPDGRSDRDLNGNPGVEMLTATIGEEGEYRVRVQVQMGDASDFRISGSWLPFPAFARPGDPDGRPGRARTLAVGESVEDTLSGSDGDLVDWFSIEVDAEGTLVAVTRPVGDGEGDLVLEAFLDGDFSEPVARSDQDLQGNVAAESVSVNVEPGQTVYLRVSGTFSSVEAAYRLSSSLMR